MRRLARLVPGISTAVQLDLLDPLVNKALSDYSDA